MEKVKKLEDRRPSLLLNIIWKEFTPGGKFLDLGCGQGTDSLFMARNGFKATAVDMSEEAINKLRESAKNIQIENLETVISDVRNFNIEDKKYDVVQMSNVLQFLPEGDALKMIEKVKSAVRDNGYLLIGAFTDKDPLREIFNNRIYFKSQQLLKLFLDFSILYYYEGVVSDVPHPGAPYPHKHGVVRLIARKKGKFSGS